MSVQGCKPRASLPEVLKFFKALPGLVTSKEFQHGCLLANTGVELGNRDPEFSDFVKGFFDETRQVIQQCLERAVDSGQLSTSMDIGLLSRYLVTEFRTVLILAASGHTRRNIQQHLEVALTVLR